ncbi:MAG: NAD(P)-dependent oxidoreductase [Gemmataceae bacterium]
MTSLVIGASGQVGWQLYQRLRKLGPCIGTYRTYVRAGLIPLDLTCAAAVGALVRRSQPDLCFVPAAWTFMDGAEQQPARCLAVNVDGLTTLAKHIARSSCRRLVFFSTDHVFGARPIPWHEEERPAPVSVYGRSKWLAEQMLADLLPDRHLILRTSWVFGPDAQRKNFVYRLLDAARRGEALLASDKEHGQPTYGPDLARCAIRLAVDEARGIYHVVGPERLTRWHWARTIAHELGLVGVRLLPAPSGIEPACWSGTDPSAGQRAPRPQQIALARTKLLQRLGYDPIRAPRAGLRHMRRYLGLPAMPIEVPAAQEYRHILMGQEGRCRAM